MTPADSRRPLERRTVSRKTAGDGKLEITRDAAAALGALGSVVHVNVEGPAGETHAGEARLGSMRCTCQGDDRPHVHYFIESDVFRPLVAGSQVDLLIDEHAKQVVVVSA